MRTPPQFYVTTDRVLARIGPSGIPEVMDPSARTWHAYTALDTIHDARPIGTDEALQVVPGVGIADLLSVGETDSYGDADE
jgi:hypothetical protein